MPKTVHDDVEPLTSEDEKSWIDWLKPIDLNANDHGWPGWPLTPRVLARALTTIEGLRNKLAAVEACMSESEEDD